MDGISFMLALFSKTANNLKYCTLIINETNKEMEVFFVIFLFYTCF